MIFLLVLTGFFAGFINVMAGGGSLLTMPVMVFMGLPAQVVNGSNRVAIFLQNIAAILTFRKKGFADFRLSLTLSLCALPGTILGACAGIHLKGIWFNRVLAGVLILVLILSAKKFSKKETSDLSLPPKKRWGHFLMLGVGFYAGFIQAGVGFIVMAVLLKTLHMDMVSINMHKVFIIGVCAFTSLIIFAWKGYVWWHVGLPLALGNALGGWAGSHMAIKKGEGLIRLIFNIALIGIIIKLILTDPN